MSNRRIKCQLKNLHLGDKFELFFSGRPYVLLSKDAGPEFPNDWLAVCVKDPKVDYIPFPVNPNTTVYPL